mmetsp:Transcript_45422/g.81710  ORF Transcript_45422/g.81710 Transcript_45422/m.81710 type:complete len:234 (-) Transcript_45422:3363-4064(-)
MHAVKHFHPHLDVATILSGESRVDERPVLGWNLLSSVHAISPIGRVPSVLKIDDSGSDELLSVDCLSKSVLVVEEVYLQTSLCRHGDVTLLYTIEAWYVGVELSHIPHGDDDVGPKLVRQVRINERFREEALYLLAKDAQGLDEVDTNPHTRWDFVLVLKLRCEFFHVEGVRVQLVIKPEGSVQSSDIICSCDRELFLFLIFFSLFRFLLGSIISIHKVFDEIKYTGSSLLKS